jgi:transcription elongation factor GreA
MATRVLLTQPDFDALVRELEALRTKHRDELARRLREARAFGGSTENDDLLAVAEDAAVDQARIAQLEELVRLAWVVDSPVAGDGAGLGSTVRVSDDAGREREYVLIGRRDEASHRYEVTMASPVGKALWGARPGDAVTVALPDGRSRTLHVRDVVHRSSTTSDRAARAA